MILFLDFDGVLHHENVSLKKCHPAKRRHLSESDRRFLTLDGMIVKGQNLFEHVDRFCRSNFFRHVGHTTCSIIFLNSTLPIVVKFGEFCIMRQNPSRLAGGNRLRPALTCRDDDGTLQGNHRSWLARTQPARPARGGGRRRGGPQPHAARGTAKLRPHSTNGFLKPLGKGSLRSDRYPCNNAYWITLLGLGPLQPLRA